ncbi:hypothetical protein B0H14DRAFT_2683533, partial [Mycena olivaceomarginata]
GSAMDSVSGGSLRMTTISECWARAASAAPPDGLGKQRWGRGRCGATRKRCNGATTLTCIPTLAPEGKGEQRGSTTDVQRRRRCSSVGRAIRRVPMREEIHPSMKPELRQRGGTGIGRGVYQCPRWGSLVVLESGVTRRRPDVRVILCLHTVS